MQSREKTLSVIKMFLVAIFRRKYLQALSIVLVTSVNTIIVNSLFNYKRDSFLLTFNSSIFSCKYRIVKFTKMKTKMKL